VVSKFITDVALLPQMASAFTGGGAEVWCPRIRQATAASFWELESGRKASVQELHAPAQLAHLRR
jgi:hypothetical protein